MVFERKRIEPACGRQARIYADQADKKKRIENTSYFDFKL